MRQGFWEVFAAGAEYHSEMCYGLMSAICVLIDADYATLKIQALYQHPEIRLQG